MASRPPKKSGAKELGRKDMKKTKGGIIVVNSKPGAINHSPAAGGLDPCVRNRIGSMEPCI